MGESSIYIMQLFTSPYGCYGGSALKSCTKYFFLFDFRFSETCINIESRVLNKFVVVVVVVAVVL